MKQTEDMIQLQAENERLKQENLRLQAALNEKMKLHKMWEEKAVRYHDILWQALLKYDPETYKTLYPERAGDAPQSDFESLL